MSSPWTLQSGVIAFLIAGHAFPGIQHGQDPYVSSPVTMVMPPVKGLALGFKQNDGCGAYDPLHIMYCQFIPDEVVTLAQIVIIGLRSISDAVNKLVMPKDTPYIYQLGLWGWHVAHCWCQHIEKREVVFGPSAIFHWVNHWQFAMNSDNRIAPYKLLRPSGPAGSQARESYLQYDCMEHIKPYLTTLHTWLCKVGATMTSVNATPQPTVPPEARIDPELLRQNEDHCQTNMAQQKPQTCNVQEVRTQTV